MGDGGAGIVGEVLGGGGWPVPGDHGPAGPAPVRMVASDLDGTLLRRDGTLSARTVAAVDAMTQAGIPVVLVSARPPRWVDAIVDQLACHPLVACSNGALLYDAPARRLVTEHAISPEVAAEIVRRLRLELEGVAFSVEAGVGYGQEPHYFDDWPVPPDTRVATVEVLTAEPVAKLIARHAGTSDHGTLVGRIRRLLGGLAEVTISGAGAPIEIAPAGVTKATAVSRLADQLGVAAEGVVAFGDMPNDLPMLGWAGYSVATANAHPDVLAVADEIAADCDEDGVATVMERILALGGKFREPTGDPVDLRRAPRVRSAMTSAEILADLRGDR